MSHDVELLVIGSGPAGQKAAIQGAKLGKRVAIVERGHMVGGVCVNTGTIPSKSLREAIVYLTGMSQREIYGSSYRVKPEITIADLDRRTRLVIERETDVIQDQLLRNHVELLHGTARFVDPNTMTVALDSGGERVMGADNIVLAVGTRPAARTASSSTARTVIDSDGLLNMRSIPALARRRRRRRDRARVRLDARRPGDEGHPRREARRDARLLRRGDRREPAPPSARQRCRLPLRRERRRRRAARRRDDHAPRERQANRGRGRVLLGRAPRRHGRARPRRRPG